MVFLSLIAHRSFTLTLYQQGKEKSKTKLVLLPWEQRFLSCMVFSVYEVDGVAC